MNVIVDVPAVFAVIVEVASLVAVATLVVPDVTVSVPAYPDAVIVPVLGTVISNEVLSRLSVCVPLLNVTVIVALVDDDVSDDV